MSFTDSDALRPEDYNEPVCPLCVPDKQSGKNNYTPINVRRVIEKSDAYLARDDSESAGRTLEYWLKEAELGNDPKGMFAMHNELMGFYRKAGDDAKASYHASEALRLSDEIGYADSLSGGTAYINAATVSKAFGRTGEAIERFEKAEKIITGLDDVADSKIAGLNNNMALALCDAGRYEEAFERFERAIDCMRKTENGEAEQAVTYLNMADAVEASLGAEDGAERISGYIEKAYGLLMTETLPKDGDYAYYCRTCAPSFGYYGYFAYEAELYRRAEEIYSRERNRS